MGTFQPDQQGGLTYMTLHELITLMILPIGTLGTNEIQYIKYTSEYILKLEIHQHITWTINFVWHIQGSQMHFWIQKF